MGDSTYHTTTPPVSFYIHREVRDKNPGAVVPLANRHSFSEVDVLRLIVRKNLVLDRIHSKGHKRE